MREKECFLFLVGNENDPTRGPGSDAEFAHPDWTGVINLGNDPGSEVFKLCFAGQTPMDIVNKNNNYHASSINALLQM